MLFNSLDFAIFLPIVFVLYWFVANRNVKLQNALIVFASYIFYGWWDWRFLSLIVFSTLVDFGIGRRLKSEKNRAKRIALLWTSILVNLGFLGFFKYYNFFLDNFIAAFSFFGHEINASNLEIILPVGISFYTFQTLSYTIDVYRKKLQPTENLVAFSAFVCFFPQLVAGPIEKAHSLLPQILKNRQFDSSLALNGCLLMTYGFFKKVVIADNLAPVVDRFYSSSVFEVVNLSEFVVASLAYSFQIYCDFSGYSDIAIGTASLFGIALCKNFSQPYFSHNPVEFWHRWHISLSTWFRDYLFIPLGGSKLSKIITVRNLFVVFVVSGFWHGADWTFVIWGVGHFLYYIAYRYTLNYSRKSFLTLIVNFLIITALWIPFRSVNTEQFISLVHAISKADWVGIPFGKFMQVRLAFLLSLFAFCEFGISQRQTDAPRVLTAFILILVIAMFGNFNHNAFVYFQF